MRYPTNINMYKDFKKKTIKDCKITYDNFISKSETRTICRFVTSSKIKLKYNKF